jgi:hypothetical protein
VQLVVALLGLMEIRQVMDLLEILVVQVVVVAHKIVHLVVKLKVAVLEVKDIRVEEDGDITIHKVVEEEEDLVVLDLLDLVVQQEVQGHKSQHHLEIHLHSMILLISGILLVVQEVLDMEQQFLVALGAEELHQAVVGDKIQHQLLVTEELTLVVAVRQLLMILLVELGEQEMVVPVSFSSPTHHKYLKTPNDKSKRYIKSSTRSWNCRKW